MKVATFGDRLYKILKDKKISRTELSERTGLSRQAIYKYINNISIPRVDTIQLLSETLNVNEAYLLGYDVDENGNAKSKFNDVRKNNEDVNFLNIAVGEALEMMRVKNNKTINDVADILGRKPTTIHEFETGEELIPVVTVIRLCHHLNYNLGEFYKDVIFFYEKLKSCKRKESE